MDLLTLFTIGILSGQCAAALNGYSLGAIGNSIAGSTGALFLGKYMAPLLGIPAEAGMFAGGILGAFVILVVFSAGESLTRKKNRFF